MKPILMLICLSLAAQSAPAQKGGGCTDPGIQWTINLTYVDGTTPNAIQGDGSPYINGQSGVDARVNVCSGTYDATLLLGHQRTMSISFAQLLASNSFTPSWAKTSSTETGTGFLNVRNIFFVPSGSNRSQEFTFTTRFGSTGPENGNLTMINPSAEAPSSAPNLALANTPYTDSLVYVHHCPATSSPSATCSGITNETWLVYPDPTVSGTSAQTGLPLLAVGTLLISNRGGEVNAGQFSVPFFFTISLLN